MKALLQITALLLPAVLWAAGDNVNYRYDQAGRLVAVEFASGGRIDYVYDAAGNLLRREVTVAGGFATVSSATFAEGEPVAPESIASGFGAGLAAGTASAKETPLPTELLGTRVEITDSGGKVRAAPLFFVSPGQVNYLIPPGTAPGQAVVRTISGAGGVIPGVLQIAPVAPGLYTFNQQGTGIAAAFSLRVAADGTQTRDLLVEGDTLEPKPVDLGPAGDRVYLELFGTGMRGVSQGATATVGGEPVDVFGPVAHSVFPGLDQINIGPLPRSLAGRGTVEIRITVDGVEANVVQVMLR